VGGEMVGEPVGAGGKGHHDREAVGGMGMDADRDQPSIRPSVAPDHYQRRRTAISVERRGLLVVEQVGADLLLDHLVGQVAE
jgi:hypothetical protein